MKGRRFLPLVFRPSSMACFCRLWILSVKLIRQFSSLSALTVITVGQSWCPLIKHTAAVANASSAWWRALHSSWSRWRFNRSDLSCSSRFSLKSYLVDDCFRWRTCILCLPQLHVCGEVNACVDQPVQQIDSLSVNEHTSILLFPALLQLNSMAIFEQNAVRDQFFTPN